MLCWNLGRHLLAIDSLGNFFETIVCLPYFCGTILTMFQFLRACGRGCTGDNLNFASLQKAVE